MSIETRMAALMVLIDETVEDAIRGDEYSSMFVDFTVAMAAGAYDMRVHRAEIDPDYTHWMLEDGVSP